MVAYFYSSFFLNKYLFYLNLYSSFQFFQTYLKIRSAEKSSKKQEPCFPIELDQCVFDTSRCRGNGPCHVGCKAPYEGQLQRADAETIESLFAGRRMVLLDGRRKPDRPDVITAPPRELARLAVWVLLGAALLEMLLAQRFGSRG